MFLHKIVPAAIMLFISSTSYSQVNGHYHVEGNIPILHLWGSNTEMGFAYGSILGEEVTWLLENELISSCGGAVNYELVRLYFQNNFTVPQRFQDVAEGIIQGTPDSLLHSVLLARNFDADDIHVGNAILDLGSVFDCIDSTMGCTSLSAWGNATMDDPMLQGGAAMARNWDYSVFSETASHPILIVYSPDDGNKWLSAGMIGYIGCISGMNEHGVAIACNISNYQQVTITEPDFVPSFYRMAEGLVNEDYDGSGSYDLGDIVAAGTDTLLNNAPSQIWHAIALESLEYQGNRGIAIEMQNSTGISVRTAADDPVLAPDHIAATNHHRVLFPPVSCWRYDLITDSLLSDPDLNLERFWEMMNCCNQAGTSCTFQTMIFDVENLSIGLAFADSLEEACEKDPVWFTLEDLTGIEDAAEENSFHLSILPNPVVASATLNYTIEIPGNIRVEIFDVSGRIIRMEELGQHVPGNHSRAMDLGSLSTGVYLVRVSSEEIEESCRMVRCSH